MNIVKILDERDTRVFLQNLLSANGGKIHLTSVGRGTRVIRDVTQSDIIYSQAENENTHQYSIKLFVDTCIVLNGRRVDRNTLKKYSTKYLKPCNVLTFMLLVNLIYNTPIQGGGVRGNPYYM